MSTRTYSWNLMDVESLELGHVKRNINKTLVYPKMCIIAFLIIIFVVFQIHHYKVYNSYIHNYPNAKSKPRKLR